MAPVWNGCCLMNRAGSLTGIPGLFFLFLPCPGGCGSHDMEPGRVLRSGAGGPGQEAVRVT